MKQIYLFIFIFLSLPLFAQVEFAPAGAEWHIGTTLYYNWGHTPDYGLLHLRYEGVTFELDGYAAKELVSDTGKDTIAQDGYKIYVYDQGAFVLIYDFGQAVGDTLHVPNWALDAAPVVDLIVAKIDTVEINGTALLNFTYDYPAAAPYGDTIFVANNKLGGLDVDILHPFAYQIDYSLGFNSRCYEDTEFGFYLIDTAFQDACSVILLDQKNVLDEYLAAKIHPNPVSSILHVDFSGKQLIQYQIIDLFGRPVQVGQLKHEIDVSFLPSGMYFLELMDGGRVVERGQFVRE